MTDPVGASLAALVQEARDWANVLEYQQGKLGSDYGIHAPTFADLLRKLAAALEEASPQVHWSSRVAFETEEIAEATAVRDALNRVASGAAPAPPDPKEPK